MSINHEVQPQSYVCPPRLEGELILARSNGRLVGRTGYVEWKSGEYAFNGCKNAIMKMIDYSPPDIEIDKSVREKGIGLGLLDKLIDRLIMRSFNMLIIARPDGQREFYRRAFEKLEESEKIDSFCYDISFTLDNAFEVRI